MKSYNNLYEKIISIENLLFAELKARKGKTNKFYVIEFEKELLENIFKLHCELNYSYYLPKHLQSFIIRDPKTRKIHKSDFRDRIVHHAIVNILEPIFEKIFICDSYANRKNKGNLKAIGRFYHFIHKVSNNGAQKGLFNKNQIKGYCLKADIKHYFQEVDQEILLNILKRKIADKNTINLIQVIVANFGIQREREITNWFGKKGMPLGNLTSQFFANVYLNELDYFVKHKLKTKYYIRYVDDFVILHKSKGQLELWKREIDNFLKEKLKLELHHQKSKVISLSKGIDFLGFRCFYNHVLLRKRNIRKIEKKVLSFSKNQSNYVQIIESYQGWQAYAKWANTLHLRRRIAREIYKAKKFI